MMFTLLKKKTTLLLFSLLMLLALAACSGDKTVSEGQTQESQGTQQSEDSSNAKSISLGITTAPGGFSPINSTSIAVRYITDVMFDSLFQLNENFEFVPLLANSLETEDNKTFTVTLNPDAKWTDGEPVTADDVMFTLKMITHPEVSSLIASNFAVLEGVGNDGKLIADSFDNFPGATKIDEHTVEFHTKNPIDIMTFHESISFNLKMLPEHVLKDVAPSNFDQHPFMQEPTVTYGAFKFVSYQRNQYVELEANKDYFRGEPKLDKLFFKIVSGTNLVTQLGSGDIHMNVPEIGAIPIQDFETVMNMSHIETSDGLPLNLKFIGFNNENISDPKIRQAVAYGINRKLLVDNLLKGAGDVTNVPYAPVHPYHNDDVKDLYPYDPEKAKQLLTEAGWDSSKELDFIVPTGNTTMENAADIVVQNLREIGITAKIRTLDTSTAIAELQKGEYDMFLWNSRFKLDPDIARNFQSGSSLNLTRYSNKEADEMMTNGLQTPNPDERQKYYDRLQEILAEDLPQITLYTDKILRAKNKAVTVGEPKDLGMLINVHEWDISN